jgi:RNA polymerase sigma factor (sigma-70 family)
VMEFPLRAVPTDDAAEAHAEGSLTESFEGFVGEHSTRLFRALYLMTGSRFEAEEVMQDAFLALWERWERVASMDDPAGYLFRTAMNLWRKRLRRAALAVRKAVASTPHDDGFAAVEDRDVVFSALRELKPAERAAIVTTSLLGYSSEEAGRMLGMTASTVRMHASRGRAAMKDLMGEPA